MGAVIVRRLTSQYPIFTAYLACSIARSTVLIFIQNPGTNTSYATVWMTTEPLLTLLRIGLVLELFQRVCDHYAGIGRFGRTLVAVFSIAALIATVATIYPDIHAFTAERLTMQAVVLFQRITATASAVFLTLAAAFFIYFRRPFKRNVVIHGWILALYFVAAASSYMLFLVHGTQMRKLLSELFLTVSASCFAAWTLFLTRRGEVTAPVPAISDRESERIERWNRELMQAGRWLVQ